jgi:glycosyltransferase involved in cell wall biosynthesis
LIACSPSRPEDLLLFSARPCEGYLAFLGCISPEKRPHRAIEIVARAGLPLKIAAKVDKADKAYWKDVIAPLIRANPAVEFIGEISEHQKAQFLGLLPVFIV